ncbi:unnamed protein product (macronuclear) [Paramecium tetraurelia]|uniref:Response regulatory domain-containing protein n=1 Tax=Paramecium tetraurelia TaxID=5888 RepID=A0EEY5_PARTE|nr:uncharacterized protein GSPATT00026199001 [Paramecium tetraurelia]CAK93876.1 unnamed protein product [Paramecium tetraurelia]|eukprot:XP_001461249.1 hypothetical protein (macronuclear) [Paramecium tetraurelia strain d4-2]
MINSTKISVLKHKKKELLKTKWPYFINLCRLQIFLALIQLLINFLLIGSINNYETFLIDTGISLIINIIDRCFLCRLNNRRKFRVIILLNFFQGIYIGISEKFIHDNELLQFNQPFLIHFMTKIMWMVALISTQPLFTCKIIIFLFYYFIICYSVQLWKTTLYDLIIVILIFIFYTVQEEEKFRRLICNQIIPEQIISQLPQPIFLIDLSTLEFVIYNDMFKQYLNSQKYESDITSTKKMLSQFQSYGNQQVFNIIDAERLNLFETIQIIKIQGQVITQNLNYQFILNDKEVYDVRFHNNIMYNEKRCLLVCLSDISAIIEKTKLSERTILKSKLIKSLSHELRTRKNIIQGLLKLYLDKNNDDSNKELICQAYNNSKIESNIISSIINYNLCLDNQVIIKYQFVKVNEILDKIIDNFKYEINSKQIKILDNYHPEDNHSLFTDPDIFEQIITNIVSNSIKHCDKQNQSILSISICKETNPIANSIPIPNPNNPYIPYLLKMSNCSSFQSLQELHIPQLERTLNIKIVDNGSGINTQKLKLIEEILNNDNYYQFTTSSSDGFYLGLRSCNLLLQKLNQETKVNIHIRSTEYEETEVVLKFLIHNQTKEYEQSIESEDCIQQIKIQKKLQNKCNCLRQIMIVDDEPFNNLVLEQILRSLNFKVIKAENGLEALSLYREQYNLCEMEECKLFYAIFMDYQMPIMNGLESTKAIIEECIKLKQIQTNIIGCTAFSATDDINELLNAGMKNVCIKPINKDSIKRILSHLQ